jgi:acetyl-CoA C-acetyltransferase
MKQQNGSLAEQHIPVIIGVGEITQHLDGQTKLKEPIELMAQAIQLASQDCASKHEFLSQIDAIDIVNSMTCDYVDICSSLCDLLSIHPTRQYYGQVGGESPVRFVHEAASRIAKGESVASVVCGAEALYSLNFLKKHSADQAWPTAKVTWIDDLKQLLHPLAVSLDVAQPTNVYPLYENALTQAYAVSPAQAQQQSAELWAQLSKVATQNPHAWTTTPKHSQEIYQVSEQNRLVAWPYTKYMIANPQVNQGAALILTNLAKAREMGVPEEKIIHIWLGASALEARDYTQRDNFTESQAMSAVLNYCQTRVNRFDAVELYSCFPCVPKMAKRILNLPDNLEISVTGGLSFFGAPLNNYMTHSIAAMVRFLRQKPQQTGLVYGQGEFVTKHHAIVLANYQDHTFRLNADHQIKLQQNTKQVVSDYEGKASLETFTILYDRKGRPTHGVAVLKVDETTRTLAKVAADDVQTISLLQNQQQSPIGKIGMVKMDLNQLPVWSISA